jgi:hypothetical protein
LHLTVPSMNRHNQTQPSTFSILPVWTFFRDSYIFYFWLSNRANSRYLCLICKQI